MLNATAIILSGGKSSRFGANKALVDLWGEPLIATLCKQLLEQFPRVAVVTKSPAPYVAVVPPEVSLVLDRSPDANPLIGLEAGLRWAEEDEVFVLACDMPFGAAPAVISRLHAALGTGSAAAFTRQGTPEPLCAFYRRSACLPSVLKLVEAGRGPRHLLTEVRAQLLPYEAAFPEDLSGLPFLDLDTPEDLERVRQMPLTLGGSLPSQTTRSS